MLRKKAFNELGSPDIIFALGYANPPCVSKELAESRSDFVTTVVMQASIFEKEVWKDVIDLITNARQVVSSVQDVARKLAEYAKFRGRTKHSELSIKGEVDMVQSISSTSNPAGASCDILKSDETASEVAELYVLGTLYYLKRIVVVRRHDKREEIFMLCKRETGEHFQRKLFSINIILDHKCDIHYYAMRDVLKGLRASFENRNLK
ncbi:unnamed protein product [Fraxinus pennsylvanica]|uniref:Uncharacterized protein n=1 Tax=Fraxinus pennsylvanica TaxID=56036 RepID=A0AAD2DR31_9LAMI|nr:unnamed protein product [Fraxinus pennsylvanica]